MSTNGRHSGSHSVSHSSGKDSQLAHRRRRHTRRAFIGAGIGAVVVAGVALGVSGLFVWLLGHNSVSSDVNAQLERSRDRFKALVEQAGATLVGAGAAIEKRFQGGGDRLREMGVRVESLARITAMDDSGVTFG